MDYNLQPGAPIAFRIASSATADFDEETTRLLHKQWEGKWEEYKETIVLNEEIVRCFLLESITSENEEDNIIRKVSNVLHDNE